MRFRQVELDVESCEELHGEPRVGDERGKLEEGKLKRTLLSWSRPSTSPSCRRRPKRQQRPSQQLQMMLLRWERDRVSRMSAGGQREAGLDAPGRARAS